jgi:hypothetical protein
MKKFILISILLSQILLGCKKDHSSPDSNSVIEIYLLKTYSKDGISSKIINESVVLEDQALINDNDIYSYNQTTCTFTISAAKAQWLNDFQTNKTHGKAFAVTVNKNIIYTGYFWAGFSSASVDWIVIDPLNYTGKNTLTVKIGYPGLFPGMNIPDLRNDPRIIEVLRSTNRLN